MRKIAEIRQDLNAAIERVRNIDRNDIEAMEKATEEIRKFTTELNLANEAEAAEQRLADQRLDRAERIAGRRFSYVKFIREAVERMTSGTGGFTGLEKDVAEMGAEEARRLGVEVKGFALPSAVLRSTGQNYTTAADGGNLIETMAPRYLESLKQKLVLTKLGATFLSDLVGTVPLISSSDITAAWAGEGATGTVTKAEYAKATMTPHRNYTRVAVTKDLLRQTSFDVEADLIDKMTTAHAVLLETAAIAGTGSANQPTGILNTPGISEVAMGTDGDVISWAKVVELETKVNAENANRGNLAYLSNAKVNGALKTTEKASGSGRFILEKTAGNRLNGYPFEWSNLVPSNLTKGTGTGLSAIVFGNFKDLYIGQWGGVDLVINPFSKDAEAEILITMNVWNDVKVAEPKSFAAIKDVKTA